VYASHPPPTAISENGVNVFVLLLLTLLKIVSMFLVGFTVERLLIADTESSTRNLYLNCACTVAYQASLVTLGAFVTAQLAALALRLPFHGILDLSWVNDHRRWLAGMAIAFCWLAIQDFFYYWLHRLQHRSSWLWAEHEVHHSDEHVNVTTTFRHHWLEPLLQAVFMGFPLALLFRPPVMLAVSAYLLANFYSSFIHLNARITLGPLNRFFANPSTHRIHHSKLPHHIDKNFAAYFPLWDVIFGTYCAPAPGEIPPTGLAHGECIDSFGQALSHPFRRWAGMSRQ
jgi:sterol desaturase/sphingolipid hydroxylase (fatty acid hydroxylase superfamily)